MDNLVLYALSTLAVLIILTVHEYAHAYTAYKLGDPTARNLGRLSLNPLKHIDPVGALFMIFFHFGWAKPVPLNPRNFKNPKRDFAITALAGPLSNMILAFISAFFYLLFFSIFSKTAFTSDFLMLLAENFLLFLYLFHIINVGIGIFNLIPVPPLDGSRLLNVFLPPKAYFAVMRYERNIYLILVGWLLLGSYVAKALLSVPFIAANPVLSFIAGLFSLSDILSALFAIVSDAMLSFWQLIPFLKL